MALAVQISADRIEQLRLEGYWSTGYRARITAGAVVYKPNRMVDINLDDALLS
jgi:hypothetical protein